MSDQLDGYDDYVVHFELATPGGYFPVTQAEALALFSAIQASDPDETTFLVLNKQYTVSGAEVYTEQDPPSIVIQVNEVI